MLQKKINKIEQNYRRQEDKANPHPQLEDKCKKTIFNIQRRKITKKGRRTRAGLRDICLRPMRQQKRLIFNLAIGEIMGLSGSTKQHFTGQAYFYQGGVISKPKAWVYVYTIGNISKSFKNTFELFILPALKTSLILFFMIFFKKSTFHMQKIDSDNSVKLYINCLPFIKNEHIQKFNANFFKFGRAIRCLFLLIIGDLRN